jgi:hypothetical protein
MQLDEISVLSEDLRHQALIHPSREVFFPNACVDRVFWELTIADRVILGFDILTMENSKPCTWGTSGYELDGDLLAKRWDVCVTLSLQLAMRDLGRIGALSGLKPPFDDVYYAIVAIDQKGWTKMLHEPRSIVVRRSPDK